MSVAKEYHQCSSGGSGIDESALRLHFGLDRAKNLVRIPEEGQKIHIQETVVLSVLENSDRFFLMIFMAYLAN